MAAIIPPKRDLAPVNRPSVAERAAAFGGDGPHMDVPQPMSRRINRALTYPETVVMGEDVGRKGGVYGVTQKLQARFGPSRVIDTLLD